MSFLGRERTYRSRTTAVAAATCDCRSAASVVYVDGVTCAFARRRISRLKRIKRGPAAGWQCSSGSGFYTGGYCERGRKIFG